MWFRRCFKSLFSVLAVSLVFSSETKAASDDSLAAANICADFVERLVSNDYQLLININFVSLEIRNSCKTAYKNTPSNPVFTFGYAKVLELGNLYSLPSKNQLSQAVNLLRNASNLNYEPATFQLFRYLWDNQHQEDPFLLAKYALVFKITDDPKYYIEKLKNSNSLNITNTVLGFLVYHYENSKLAKIIVQKNLARGSIKAKFYLGLMHTSGFGVNRNFRKGYEGVRMAAIAGDAEAQIALAQHVGSGIFVNKHWPYADVDEGYRLLVEAVNKGNKFGFVLLYSYIEGISSNIHAIPQAQWDESRSKRFNYLKIVSCGLREEKKRELLLADDLPPCDE